MGKKIVSIFILVSFFATGQMGTHPIYAQDFRLPAPGLLVHLSLPFDPLILKGIKVHQDNPFRFDFILDKGDSGLSNDQLKDESSKLIKYFLASLTIPEKDLWVNLSPYEEDRIVPQSFGMTGMGRDLLGEDYMLKQITASLIYPEDEIGKRFWKRIYEEAQKKFGTTNVAINTFNKVWIVPEKAVVFENAKAGAAYVVESKLKVMLEQDYLSLEKHEPMQSEQRQVRDANQLGSQIVREIVIPELTKEVNENKNFAKLRQAYNSLILATWYKKKIKYSILSQMYEDKNKVAGINIDDPKEKERIYQKYLMAFKKGVYNYIKEEAISLSRMPGKEQGKLARKYFSGGVDETNLDSERIFHTVTLMPHISLMAPGEDLQVTTDLAMTKSPAASTAAPMDRRAMGPLEPLTKIHFDDINTNNKQKGLRALIIQSLPISRRGSIGIHAQGVGEYVDRMRNGERLIEDPPAAVDTPLMGEIDLNRLNHIELYDKRTIVADLLRDLWLADRLGLLGVDLRSNFGFKIMIKDLKGTELVDKNSLNPVVRFEDYWVIRYQMLKQVLVHKDMYTGDAGQVKFVREMKDQGKIQSTNLGSIYTVLDDAWVKALGWGVMNMPLEEAENTRELVANLVGSPEQVEEYKGNAGQVKFVREMKDQGKIQSTNLANIYTVLDVVWVKALGWEKMSMPLEETEKVRELVAKLVENPTQVEQYKGNTGQVKFVREMKDQGNIQSTHLGQIYSVLDNAWVKALGWEKMSMPLEETEKVRELIAKLVENPTQVEQYKGNAGQVKFVREMKDQGKVQSTNLGQIYSVLDDAWIKVLGWGIMNMPLEEAEKVRELVADLVKNPARAEQYKGNAGQVRFVREMKNDGKIQSTNLGNIYSVLDDAWIKALGWGQISLPLEEAENIRALVANLVGSPERVEQYKGNAGHVKFVREMKDQRRIQSTNLGNIYTVLDDAWVEALGWRQMNMPLEEAENTRELVVNLVGSPEQVEEYKGNAGQVKFVREMKNDGKIQSTNLGQIYTVLDDAWIKALGWGRMDMSLEGAENTRELVANLVGSPERVEQYKGNAGQVKFVREMKNEGKIQSTNLGQIYTVLDDAWVKALGWGYMNMSLEETEKVRELVGNLVESLEQVEEYKGNAGQVKFVREMKDQGKIQSTNLGNIYSVLDDAWVKVLGWGQMNMPLEEAENTRELVAKLVESPEEVEQYKGNAGQMKFVREMKDQGKIQSTHLGQIYTVLDDAWVKALGWGRMDMPLDQTEKVRELVVNLVGSPEQVERYKGNAGQVKFVREMKDRGKIESTNLGQIYTVLDDAWVKSLGWGQMKMPLEETEKIRELVANLVESLEEVEQYKGKAGQVKFVREMKNEGKIQSTNLGHIYSVLDDVWVKALGWGVMDMPLEEAENTRALVANLVESPAQVEEYKGNAGQVKFVREMKDQRKIQSTNLGQIYSVLDDAWVEVLEWKKMNMPLEEAENTRKLVAKLVESLEQVDQYKGNAGQVKFVRKMKNEGKIQLTNLGQIYTVLDGVWINTLGWKYIGMSLEEAEKDMAMAAINQVDHAMGVLEPLTKIQFDDIDTNNKQKGLRALIIQSLAISRRGSIGMDVQKVSEYVDRMRNKEQLIKDPPAAVDIPLMGEIDLNRLNDIELYNKRTIVVDLLRDLWLADRLGLLNVDLRSDFGFGIMGQALKGTGLIDKNSLIPRIRFDDYWMIRYQMVKQVLVHKDMYIGDAGQVRFVREMKDQGKIQSTNLGSIYVVLDEAWVKALGWGRMDMSLEEAEKTRELVANLVKSPTQVEEYKGNAGQVKFVREMKDQRKIQSTNLGSIYAVLDDAWVKALGWGRMNMPLEEAENTRKLVAELVAKLVESPTQVEEYKGNAGQVRFVREMKNEGKIQSTNLGNIYSVLDDAWVKALGWGQMNMPLEEAENTRKLVAELVAELVKSPAQVEQYTGNGGQVRFVREMKNEGKIQSTNLGQIYTVLDDAWIKALGWGQMNMPLEEAENTRELVATLVANPKQVEEYKGNAGQVRFVREMKNEGKIQSTNLGSIYVVLDDAWVKALGWGYMNMSLEETEKVRELVGNLVESLEQVEEYKGNAGQVKFVRDMKEQGKVQSTNLGNIYSVLDDAWVKALGWGVMNMPLEEAENTRELVAKLVESPEEVEQYKGNAGQVKFVREMKNEGKIRSTNLGQIYTVLDDKWVEALGWEKMDMPLEETEKVRELVAKLVESQTQVKEYKGNAGQVRFVREMKNEGKIQSTNLGQIYSVLDDKWVEALGWGKMDMPLEETEKVRELVAKLVESLEEVEQYKGNAGQVKFVREMKDQRKIQSTNLGNIYSVLDDAWVEVLEWKKMNMPLEEAENTRELVATLVAKLVESPAQVEEYKGNAGQVKFVREMKDQRKIQSTNLGNIYSVLDDAWVEVLEWKKMNMPLEEAENTRKLVAKLVESLEEVEQYKGNAGQVRFVREMKNEGKIQSTNLGQIYTVLDEVWINTLGWKNIGMSLEDAEKDMAMAGVATPKESLRDLGGIDLSRANTYLQTKNSNGEIKFHLDPAMLQELQNSTGFIPVIVNIQPLKSLTEFLGVPNDLSADTLTHA